MIAVTRYRVPEAEAAGFLDLARAALAALAARPGHLDGVVGRSTDDPSSWVLVTTWRGVGDYRRALSSYEVKLQAQPLLQLAVDEPSAFETLLATDASGALTESPSDRNPGADRPEDPLR